MAEQTEKNTKSERRVRAKWLGSTKMVDITTHAPEDKARALQEAHRKRCPITALFRESGMELEDEWRIVRPKG